ncbi:hypothetical protein K474DRAFT_1613483, partial [Panus rudis PR-1116 ss-1]
MNLARIITREDIKIDDAEREAYGLTEDTEWFLRRAMTKDPSARPDATTLKRHLFFRDFNWDELSPGSTRCAPWIPGPQRIGNLARVSHEGQTLDSGRPLGPLEDSVPFFTHVSPLIEQLPTLFEQSDPMPLTRAPSSMDVPVDPFDSFDAQVPELVHYSSDSSISTLSASIRRPLVCLNTSVPPLTIPDVSPASSTSDSDCSLSSLSALQFAIVSPAPQVQTPTAAFPPRLTRNRPVRKPVPHLESFDLQQGPPATPAREPQENSGTMPQPEDPETSLAPSCDSSSVVFVDGIGFELVMPQVALPLDCSVWLGRSLRGIQDSSVHANSMSPPAEDPLDVEAPSLSPSSGHCSSLDLKYLAREEYDIFDNSAPWARMHVVRSLAQEPRFYQFYGSSPISSFVQTPGSSRDRDANSDSRPQSQSAAQSTARSSSTSSHMSSSSSSIVSRPSTLCHQILMSPCTLQPSL